MTTGHGRTNQGIAAVLTGVLCLCVSDALAKALGGHYAASQLLFLRTLIAFPMLVSVLFAVQGARALRTATPGLHLFRGAVNVATAVAFYTGLTLLPLSTATAISFSAPMFVVVLSLLFLGERVPVARWICVALGFAGVLAACRPSTGEVPVAVLYPLASALGYAILMLSSRGIAANESMFTTTLYIVLGQLLFSVLPAWWQWRAVEMSHLPMLAGLALFSTLGLGLVTQAFRLAPASVVAPLDYSGLVWAALIGWFVWGENPSGDFYLGALLISGSGIAVVLLRDRPGHSTPA